MKIEICGLEPFEAELDRMQGLSLEPVIQKQLVEMLNRAREPGGTPIKTGELRLSSGVGKDEMGYGAEYAAHVEYGHRTVSGGYVEGRRYLERNVETQREIFRSDLVSMLGRR